MRTRILTTSMLALVLGMAACTSSGPGVATVDGGTPSATPGLGEIELARQHARCMREHGVPEADPQLRPDGTVQTSGGFAKDSVDADAMAKALNACRSFEQPAGAGDVARRLDGQREYARCMRAHGVEGFPDPDSTGDIQLPVEITDPDFDQAKAACDTPDRSSRTPS